MGTHGHLPGNGFFFPPSGGAGSLLIIYRFLLSLLRYDMLPQ